MKILNNPIKFLIFAVGKAVTHPRTPIRYYYCSHCDIRFNGKECPKCCEKVN